MGKECAYVDKKHHQVNPSHDPFDPDALGSSRMSGNPSMDSSTERGHEHMGQNVSLISWRSLCEAQCGHHESAHRTANRPDVSGKLFQ